MNPPRRRQVKLVVSLTLAVLLASGLIYTSFSAANPALTPSQLLTRAHTASTVQLTGTVVSHTVRDLPGGALAFRLVDRTKHGPSVLVDYSGSVPPTFQPGRELIVTGELHHGRFVAQPGSMITKCPSKYSAAPSTSA